MIDGCPAGIPFDLELVRRDLSRRRPGQALTTARSEADEPVVLSGVFEGVTTGAPIAIVVANTDQRSGDYDALRDLFRPSHADYTYSAKYGTRDHRGGGRSSARETLARVIGGAVARMILAHVSSIDVVAAVTRLGDIVSDVEPEVMSSERVYASPVRCDDPTAERLMIERLEKLREEGDSIGGVVSVGVSGMPVGLGEPIYGKLNATLAAAMMSINGALGFEMGIGFHGAESRGSENNDQWIEGEEGLRTASNNSGGVQGGISNGMPLLFRVAFKPPSSIALTQSHGTKEGGTIEHAIDGRHDPSIVIRAVPVVEAMTLLVLADRWIAAGMGREKGRKGEREKRGEQSSR